MNILRGEHIPRAVKIITVARSIRWFGWGMCEALIPVLLFSFSSSYLEAGLFRSVYSIFFLLSLPFVSILADRIPAKKLILFALAIYPLIGISYFLAGAFGVAFFIVLARAINGVAYCYDGVGCDTYLRRFALTDHLSKTFGYLSSLPNLAWILASLISIIFIPIVPTNWLFLAIVPTSIIAFLVLRTAPVDDPAGAGNRSSPNIGGIINGIKKIKYWKSEIWGLSYLAFFITCVDMLGTFFLPLFVYVKTSNLSYVVIITIVFAIPSAFAFWIGTFVDKLPKFKIITINLFLIAVLLGALSFNISYPYQILLIFILGILTLSITLALQALVTKASAKEHYGRIGGVMAGVEEIGFVIGLVMIGALADHGSNITFIVLGLVALFTGICLFLYLVTAKK